MSQRRRLDRERLEVYYVNLLLAFRPLLIIVGILLFGYAFLAIGSSLLVGIVVGVLAVFTLLLGTFYAVVVFTSKILAWVVTVGRREEKL
jgi:hypothetical protein